MKKTNEEIQKLKDNWLIDPSWDIEKTDGFEDHFQELLTFRKETESRWDAEKIEAMRERGTNFGEWTGIYDLDLADCLFTYKEIENEVAQQDRYIGEFASIEDQVKVELMQAQIRATLLLTAQIQKMNELLRNK